MRIHQLTTCLQDGLSMVQFGLCCLRGSHWYVAVVVAFALDYIEHLTEQYTVLMIDFSLPILSNKLSLYLYLNFSGLVSL